MSSVVQPAGSRALAPPGHIEWCSNLIERVILALRELSSGGPDDAEAPGWQERQVRLQRAGGDFADAYRLLADCLQVHVSARQAESLERLYEALFDLEGVQGGSVSGNESPSEAALWSDIHRMAANTLMELGDSSAARNPEDVRTLQTDTTRGS